VVAVHLRIRSRRAAVGSQVVASAAEAYHRFGYLSGILCAHLFGADYM
jgi:hypothetical protein